MTADAFLSGTRRRPARLLAESLDDLAATTEVSAGFDAAVARFFVLPDELDEGLDLLAEILTEPAFDEEEVSRIRDRHLDALAEQRSEPDFLARERLLERLYPGDPYGRLASTEAGLAATTAADVAAFWMEHFRRSRPTFVLAWAGEPEELAASAARRLGPLVLPAEPGASAPAPAPPPAAPPLPPPGRSVHLVRRPASSQAAILFGRRAILRSDPRWLAAIVSAHALGGGASSRLFRVLREERALTYGAFASLAARRRAGHFVASVDVRHEAAEAGVNGLVDLVRQFAEDGPTAEELRRSVDFIAGSFALARETPGSAVEDELGRVLHGLPEDESRTFRERIRAVSLEDAREASRLFHPGEGFVVAVGDPARLRPVLEPLGPLTEWDGVLPT